MIAMPAQTAVPRPCSNPQGIEQRGLEEPCEPAEGELAIGRLGLQNAPNINSGSSQRNTTRSESASSAMGDKDTQQRKEVGVKAWVQ